MFMPWNKRIRDLETRLDDAVTTIANTCVSIEEHKKNAQDMAFLVREAFEVGWTGGGGDKSVWREQWRKSIQRAVLVRMGYINEEDTWR